jgi:hypothetical protein
MTNSSNSQSLHAVSDEAWAEAVRREAVIRRLAAAPRRAKQRSPWRHEISG